MIAEDFSYSSCFIFAPGSFSHMHIVHVGWIDIKGAVFLLQHLEEVVDVVFSMFAICEVHEL